MAYFKGFAELHNMQPFADTAFLLCPLSELQSTTGIRHHDAGLTTGLSAPRPRQTSSHCAPDCLGNLERTKQHLPPGQS